MINMGKRGLDNILLPFAHEELRACSGGSCYCEALLPVVYPDLDVRLGDGKSTRKYTPKGRHLLLNGRRHAPPWEIHKIAT